MRASIPAVYMRGGTSRALMFHARDLPPADLGDDYAAWRPIFLKCIGSPDPNGRQLNGMGGGITSLSKVAVIGPSTRADADLDYTFGQVGVYEGAVSYRANCGNISSAVGPFAIDEGLIQPSGENAHVRIHNTNTGKIIIADFAVAHGVAVEDGDFELQGVAGTGAPIKLTFLDPGGSATGSLLPTGRARDQLHIDDRTIDVSLVDAANPTCFISSSSLGLSGRESAATLAADDRLLHSMREVRFKAAVAMGLARDETTARTKLPNLPLVAIVSAPNPSRFTDEREDDIVVRMFSADQPHKASPLTGAMCTAAAAFVDGSVVQAARNTPDKSASIVVRHVSGALPVEAEVAMIDGKPSVLKVTAFRTARRIMEGRVLI